MARKALIAIGGNSLILAGQRGTIEEQQENARLTAQKIVEFIAAGWQVVVTHGNGPQVGAALLRSERAAHEVYTHSLDVCVATTQSEIGYLLKLGFEKELRAAKLSVPVVVLLTQVEVSSADSAFQHPTKPIGPFYSAADAEEKKRTFGWQMVEDSARGYRRVVASPQPKRVIESDTIRKLLDAGYLVIALGGGGIPVAIRDDGSIHGVEAVIDKDRASALLAHDLKVDCFIISTAVDKVYVNYKKPNQHGIDTITAAELQKYYDENQFPAGSMGPKVESALSFLRDGGREVVITTFELLSEAIERKAGTHIIS